MKFDCNIKLRKKQVLRILMYLSGVCILIWQIWKTFEAFIQENTTFTVSKNTEEGLPTILLCPINEFRKFDYNYVNKTQFFKQFFLLNDSFNITYVRNGINKINGSIYQQKSKLILGRNVDEMGTTFFVQELMNPEFGICYALTPHHDFENRIFNEEYRLLASFENKDNLPSSIEVQFVSKGEQHNFLFPTLGMVEQRIPAKLGFRYLFKVRKIIWNFLPTKRTKRNCKKYSYENEERYPICVIENQMECYRKNGPKQGCNCIAENVYKTHFTLYQNLTAWNWNICKTIPEYSSCILAMSACHYNNTLLHICPVPCQKTEYKVSINLIAKAQISGYAISIFEAKCRVLA